MRPYSDIKIELTDKENWMNKEISFNRMGYQVGGARIIDHILEVYGFSELEGPWNCNNFRGLDCTVHFSKYRTYNFDQEKKDGLNEGYNSALLSLVNKRVVGNLARFEFAADPFDKECNPNFSEISANEFSISDIGSVWSLLKDGTDPYYSIRENGKDCVQICGFGNLIEHRKIPETDEYKLCDVNFTYLRTKPEQNLKQVVSATIKHADLSKFLESMKQSVICSVTSLGIGKKEIEEVENLMIRLEERFI